MRVRTILLLLIAGTSAGCTHEIADEPDPGIVAGALEQAAAQVKRCYRPPRIRHGGRQIVTRLRVRFASDGALIGLPTVIAQSGVSPANSHHAGEMAKAASLAVIRCAPLRLPADAYRGWQEFELTFSPSAAA